MINSLNKDSHFINTNKHRQPQSTMIQDAQKHVIPNAKSNNPNFTGFAESAKMEKLYKNKIFHSIIKFAGEQQLVFAAGFAMILTCILRPAVTMLGNKNKDDKKYASAHSMASGVIGLAISSILFSPISSAISKIKKNPIKYIKNENSYLMKDQYARETAIKYIDRLPDIVAAIPKGILTVALIPPILKYVFGMEKKKGKQTNEGKPAVVDYSLLNFKSTPSAPIISNTNVKNNSASNPTFKGTTEEIPKIEKWCIKLLETKAAKSLVERTNKIKPKIIKEGSKKGDAKKFTDKLTAHLIVLGSTMMSGFYVAKTLNNKNMDNEKRKTLAINQGLVWVVSTVMAYTFDGWIREKTNPFIDAFKKVNEADKKIPIVELEHLVDGIKLARTIMTIDMVYRFIAPVLVTPFANAIGNKLHERKEAERASSQKQA